MGVTSRTLSRNRLEGILEVFNTFSLIPQPPSRGEKKVEPAEIFEQFWIRLTNDGRYIDDFKILKNSIGKKVFGVADYIISFF